MWWWKVLVNWGSCCTNCRGALGTVFAVMPWAAYEKWSILNRQVFRGCLNFVTMAAS